MASQLVWTRKLLLLRSSLLKAFAISLTFVPSAHAAELRNIITDLGLLQMATPAPGRPNVVNDFIPVQMAALKQTVGPLNAAIGSNVNTNIFSPSVVGYTFDITQGLPVATFASLGPIVGDRADTLGAGRFVFGFGATQIRYSKYNGLLLSDISQPITVQTTPQNLAACGANPAAQCPWLNDTIQSALNIKIGQDVYVFSGTYGVTPNLDVEFELPIVHASANVVANAMIVYASPQDSCAQAGGQNTCTHRFDPSMAGFVNDYTLHQTENESATGIGDIAVRAKYEFLQQANSLPDAAVIGQVRIPTGDANQLLGSGSTDVMGMVVLSKQLGIIAPHLNAAYEVASGGFDISSFRYAAGADVNVIRSVTIAADVFGRAVQTGQNEVNLSVGAKWGIFDRGVLFGNVTKPLNSNVGLRADYIWTVGGQIYF